jgi:feruloyl esterase
MSCAALAQRDFTSLEGASARIDGAKEVAGPQGGSSLCVVTGYIASNVRFEVRLPMQGWTQRFLMVGCGGYCGFVAPDNDSVQRQSSGCAALAQGGVATAATDLGHTKSASFFPDGLWAKSNPQAIVDFAYAGMHKSTLLAKALMAAYYGQGPQYSYYSGCSDGGREGLQEVQRFPADYDGVVVGAPVIDEVATNTFYHAWGVRANSRANGDPILTADKIPSLVAAVNKACGDKGGLVQDPRRCKFDVATLVCKSADDSSCLTEEQARVVRKLWTGPIDGEGDRLSAGDMPVGSEAAWVGTMVPRGANQKISLDSVGDYQWSYDFPNYMASLDGPTGITNQNMTFDKPSFETLNALSGLYDPTDPDLSAFARRGGKLIIWHGWSDSGASPYMSLNYVDAVKRAMGASAANKFLTLYMIPGVYHCNLYGGPNFTQEDFLTPMMNWVEDGARPDKIVVEFTKDAHSSDVIRSRPLFPYPAEVAYTSGDPGSASSYERSEPAETFNDRLAWLGIDHYRPGRQIWCATKDARLVCETR